MEKFSRVKYNRVNEDSVVLSIPSNKIRHEMLKKSSYGIVKEYDGFNCFVVWFDEKEEEIKEIKGWITIKLLKLAEVTTATKSDLGGSGLFFFNTTLEEEKQLEILNWYNSLSPLQMSYVDVLIREAKDEADFFSI